MAVEISKVDVWAGKIKDRPGGLGEKLEALDDAGANLEFVISRRAPEKRGTGVVFLAPLRGAALARAARKAGLAKATGLHSLRIEGPDRAGIGGQALDIHLLHGSGKLHTFSICMCELTQAQTRVLRH